VATLDVLSSAEAAESIDAPGLSSVKLAKVVTAASLALDTYVGPVVRRTITNERHEDKFGRPELELRRWPVVSVSSCSEFSRSGTELVLAVETPSSRPSDGVRLEPTQAETELGLFGPILTRRASGRDALFDESVLVTYVAGRFTNTAAVDERYKEAVRLLVSNLFQRVLIGRGTLDGYDVPRYPFPTFAIPGSVKGLLSDVWQGDEKQRLGIA